MKRINRFILLTVFALIITVAFISCEGEKTSWQTAAFRIGVDGTGMLTSLEDMSTGVNYLSGAQPSPLLSIRIDTVWHAPESMALDSSGSMMLSFAGGKVQMMLNIRPHDTHITFEVASVQPALTANVLRWGPFSTTIGDTVGEIVGVVRNGSYAIGIQTLNPKTVGGIFENEEGAILSRGTTAVKTDFGSTLNAFSIDRSFERKIFVWHEWGDRFPGMPVPPIPGETLAGSKIALFGCRPGDVLEILGKIELSEGLPHPMIDGVWAKQSPETGRSYLIGTFTESNIDTMLDVVERAGLMSLYHEGPFENWGHFDLRRDCFPNGIAGMKRCVEKAQKRGIRIGAHTLTNFITTNDPFVTPVPDPHLAVTGSSILTKTIRAGDTEIPVEDADYFANETSNWLHCVRIGDEIIQYRKVTAEAPWKLLDCRRGMFGTKASSHEGGSTVGKLMDHGYKVFFPDFELQEQMVQNMAAFFNATGVSQMDFDGHEGCYATGQGNYAMEMFAKRFYDLVGHTVVNGSSRSSHYYWHINHYLNWGEPWYEGFRESMQEYRINNQALLERNYLPNMLGWYLLTRSTTLADIEWMLARAAGYNAGFALAYGRGAIRHNSELGSILDAIREWESAHRSGSFTKDQRERMKDPKGEFHLSKTATGWMLYPFRVNGPFLHEEQKVAPGMPSASEWSWEQKAEQQPLRFIVRTQGESGSVKDLVIGIDHVHTLTIPASLEAGESLACDGIPLIRKYDKKGRLTDTQKLAQELPMMGPGRHEVTFDCTFQGSTPPKVSVSFQTMGQGEEVRKK